MAQLFSARPANDLPEVPQYNVCPTTRIHAVLPAAEAGARRRLEGLRWGFLPHWYKTPSDGPLLINARAETVAEKPAFRAAVRERRCLVPASGFYEWTKDAEGTRWPWYMTRRDGAPLVFAGIWQDWTPREGGETLRCCAILTCTANDQMGRIHHRMPVILEEGDWPLWLGETGHGAAVLMRPAPEATLQAHQVDRAVNSNRARGPELIVPLAAE